MVGPAKPITIAPTGRTAFDLGLASAPLPLHPRSAATVTDTRVLRLLETLACELDKPQLVKDLAVQLRLSPSRLEHIFKQETGLGIKAFLRAARLKKAKDILQDPTLGIKEVAAAVGYRDVSHFARDFRKQYGQSPSQSRKSPPHHP
jgi:transcriptional regulator GlxA family with amidase domain